jgi:hypothetical protein
MFPPNTWIRITFTTICSFLIVFAAYIYSNYRLHHKYGFTRLYPPHAISFEGSRNLIYNSYYIAGIAGKKVYLGNYTSPDYLLSIDHFLRNIDTLHLRFKGQPHIAWKLAKLTIDSPAVFLWEGYTPSVFTGRFDSCKMERSSIDSQSFLSFTPLSSNSFVFSQIKLPSRERHLGKKSLLNKDVLLSHRLFGREQGDMFGSDGQLLWDRSHQRLIYVHYYSNRINCIDTNLNHTQTWSTIDTVTTPNLPLGIIHSDHAFVLAAPPDYVNLFSCIYREFLYVSSGHCANNEDYGFFKSGTDVDIYSLKNGRYIFSFHIPQFKGLKAYEFQVLENQVIALYDCWLVSYQMTFPQYLDH